MDKTAKKSFVQHFQAEVHLQYQQMGSKLRNTVRTQDNCAGASTTFKIEPDSGIGVHLYDYYAGDWVDQLDELESNINEQQVVARAGAYALGRKSDELIICELDKSTNYAGTGADGLTKQKVLNSFEMIGGEHITDHSTKVPADDYFAIVGWKQWSELLNIEEFANSQYIGDDALPWKGTQAKKWMNTIWMPHSGLTKDGSNVRYCYWYKKSALGHAIGDHVKTDITWHGDRAAHFVNNSMAQGAGLIDADGVISMRCQEI